MQCKLHLNNKRFKEGSSWKENILKISHLMWVSVQSHTPFLSHLPWTFRGILDAHFHQPLGSKLSFNPQKTWIIVSLWQLGLLELEVGFSTYYSVFCSHHLVLSICISNSLILHLERFGWWKQYFETPVTSFHGSDFANKAKYSQILCTGWMSFA